jgi:DNA modification methylase
MAPRRVRALRSLKDLVLDSKNANRGTDRGRDLLATSLQTHDLGRSILVDRLGRVIAGNKVTLAALSQGRPLRVVRTRGREVIAVQRVDLDLEGDAKARALAVADNRVAEVDLEWDIEVLKQLQAEGLDLSGFWTNQELTDLFADDTLPAGGEDNVVEPGRTSIRVGDFFALGRHRLLCGDATAPGDVTRVLGRSKPLLMVADPPYGVSYDPAWRHRIDPSQRTAVGRVTNDDRSDWTPAWRLFPGPVAYVWHAALKAGAVADHLTQAGFKIRSQIIWRKQHFAMSRADFHWAHEPAWYAVRQNATSHWCGGRAQTTVWEVPNLNPMGGMRSGENAVTGHATQKPVGLYELCLRNHTTEKDALYDPFCGSGTALIAAEKLGRVCFALEIDPRYVQATIDRWETYSKQKATKVGDPSRRRQ